MQTTGRTLVIETASEACSVALFDGPKMIAHDHRELGRGHAERLIPMIEALPENGRSSRILVSLGPGSFTGVRIGIAAARALGVAWGAKVLGYPTLALVAVRASQPALPKIPGVTVCMNGGHGEWFVQDFTHDNPSGPVISGPVLSGPIRSLTPEEARRAGAQKVIVGNRAKALAQMFDDDRVALDLLPDAQAAILLDDSTLSADLAPIYGRAPDAKPQAQSPSTS